MDIDNNTILEYLTTEPTAGNSAVVEYISFSVDEGDAPIASFSLTEEFDGEGLLKLSFQQSQSDFRQLVPVSGATACNRITWVL